MNKLHLLEAHRITGGDDVLVAVIDSKIDTKHPDLTGVVAEEYDVERKFRETRLYQVAPISTNLILAYIGEHVLDLPRSY